MSDEFNFDLDFEEPFQVPAYGDVLTWREVMRLAVLKPSTQSFQRIADDPRNTWGRAFTWWAIMGFVTALAQIILQLTSQAYFVTGPTPQEATRIGLFPMLLCALPISILVTMVSYAFHVAVTNSFARMMGGILGQGAKLAVCFAAFITPLSIAVSVLSLIIALLPTEFLPSFLDMILGLGIILLSIGVWIYILVLAVIATDAVHNIGTGKAFLANIILPAISFVLVAMFVCAIMVLLGPAIADAFQEIMNNPQYYTY